MSDPVASHTVPAPDAPRSRAKLVVFGLLLLAVSTMAAVLLAEFAVRLVAPQQLIEIRPDVWEPVDGIGYLRRPDVSAAINTGERTVTIRTDHERYRVGAAGRVEAATQVLLLGDSFMEALQVEHEQTTAALVESDLAARLGRPVAVRNAGVSGWSPNHYLIRGRELLSTDRFALTVVAVFVGNDAVSQAIPHIPPRPPTERHEFHWPSGWGRRALVDAFVAPINDKLEVRSHLFVLLKNTFSTLRMRLGLTADYLPLEYRRVEAGSARWATTAAISRALAEVGAQHGTPTLFVLVPERFQVYPDEFDRYVKGFGVDAAQLDVDQPSVRLRMAFEAAGLTVVDALPALRAVAARGGPRLYGSVDQHLSPEGHRALAKVVADAAMPLVDR